MYKRQIGDVITQTKSLGDAFRGVLSTIISQLVRLKITNPLTNALSAFLPSLFGGGGGGWAGGGVGRVPIGFGARGGVHSGWTWVGERGPELLNLGSPSRVLPSQESMAATAGGPLTLNLTVQSTDGPGVRAAVLQMLPSLERSIRESQRQDLRQAGQYRRDVLGY